ncbi:unnamed protein product [Dovyalis caffra]|uniref:Uncharacterized protein n=1 Tax=Dovyalis caffra TaxID=77055 RepID=A0AAV1S7W3_9ROSI|nr:unnamed protein product [Dovyalis caffra]
MEEEGNPGLAGAGGLIRDALGRFIMGFAAGSAAIVVSNHEAGSYSMLVKQIKKLTDWNWTNASRLYREAKLV